MWMVLLDFICMGSNELFETGLVWKIQNENIWAIQWENLHFGQNFQFVFFIKNYFHA